MKRIVEIASEAKKSNLNSAAASERGAIQFEFDRKIYKGFPLEIRQEHWANPLQTIRLLAASTPVNKRIH